MTLVKRRKGWRMTHGVGEVTQRLENEICSPTFTSLLLRHKSFSNPFVALSTSQLIIQPIRCFTYVTAHYPTLLSLLLRHRFSLTSPGEPPMVHDRINLLEPFFGTSGPTDCRSIVIMYFFSLFFLPFFFSLSFNSTPSQQMAF